ncbi:hypothetical protein B484DRAFT_417137, partial [Ochromonadaceae sp. CCMP2298]
MSKPLPKRLEEELDAKYRPDRDRGSDRASAAAGSAGPGKRDTPAQMRARVFDDSKERAMYDEILGPMLGGRSAGISGLSGISGIKASAPPSAAEFSGTLLARLQRVEVEAKAGRAQLVQQAETISRLEGENRMLRAEAGAYVGAGVGGTGAGAGVIEEVVGLRRENACLLLQVGEMETFLSDYGLEWVGREREREGEGAGAGTGAGGSVGAGAGIGGGVGTEREHTMSFRDFQRAIEQLNSSVRDGPLQVITSDKQARLVHPSTLLPSIPLAYYRNGILLKRGPFRHCGSDGYRRFLRDLKGGDFPTDRGGEYPGGVVFEGGDEQGRDYG